ncbi:uncharacterized protein LOC113358316 isoform X4 [Papaver somniferum]|uniref:uncharacterized protein LOC113358316 isoform X4 n=1 Tax=Papaver somniferum TaxID=3469 RepID=UPI000E701C97|nr:uncharacterized protein LOC113358316 isoform X4 [Papaver somniferum]
MAGYAVAVIPSFAKLQQQTSYYRLSQLIPRNSCFTTVERSSYKNRGVTSHSPAWEAYGLSGPSILTGHFHVKERSVRCCCLGMINSEITPFSGVFIVDQVLLTATIILAYMAGVVVPSKNGYFTFRKNVSDCDVVPDSTSFGSTAKSDRQVNVEYAWDAVKKKLIGALDAAQYDGNLDSRIAERNNQNAKHPLSLYALGEAPRLRLLFITLQQLEKEVNCISGGCGDIGRDDRLAEVSRIIQKSTPVIFDTWLEHELSLENRKHNKDIFPTMYKKLEGDESILRNIENSGKEDLYAEFLFFLRYGSLGVGCRYDVNLFVLFGVDILEDLVINLADGITSNYLELISVDSNMSKDMNRLGLILCSMCTRELQKLRNEVALNKWMHQNMDSIILMYEDRFDLSTFSVRLPEDSDSSEAKNLHWWQKLPLKKPARPISMLHYVVISQLSMAVKRTEELRALTGWRYYFSLFLEFSDISWESQQCYFIFAGFLNWEVPRTYLPRDKAVPWVEGMAKSNFEDRSTRQSQVAAVSNDPWSRGTKLYRGNVNIFCTLIRIIYYIKLHTESKRRI